MNGGFMSDDGSVKVAIEDGAQFFVGENFAIPAVYKGAAFTLEDGTFVEFVEGATLETENGVVVEMAIRRDQIGDEISITDGRKIKFYNDGTATISTFVDNAITFANALSGSTITLAGRAITPAKSQTITGLTQGDSPAITVDANKQSRVFSVNYGLDVAMSDLELVNGDELRGGAIFNAGTLALENVDVRQSKANVVSNVNPNDKVLFEGLGGAIYNSGSLTINGGEFARNAADYFGGAIYSIGSLDVQNAKFLENASNYFGGALYFQNSNATVANSIFESNLAALNGGAIGVAATAADSKLTIVNSLLVKNESVGKPGFEEGGEGGAIYGIGQSGKKATVEATNITVADNAAAFGGGIAVDNAELVLKNSIVARNSAVFQGADIALEREATGVLYASLIGVGDDVVNPDALSVAGGYSAFLGSTAAPIDVMFDADYRPAPASPAVNSGVNDFVAGIETDLAGGERIVDKFVDMGAYEAASFAPDLTFGEDDGLVGWFAYSNGANTGKFIEGWDVAFDYSFGNYGAGSVFTSFDYTITVSKLDENGDAIEGSAKVFTRTYGDDVNGHMSPENWLAPVTQVEGYWNLGTFAAGKYQATFSLDVADSVYESDEENNVFVFNFEVAERPSLVVTTEQDVVDDYDGLTSLREAIAAVGTQGSEKISIDKVIEDGATFTLAANEERGIEEGTVATYADGVLSYVKVIPATEETEDTEATEETTETIVLDAGVEYALTNGQTLVWNGADLITLTDEVLTAITFAPNVLGKTISIDLDANKTEFVIDRDMTISASETVTIDAQGASRAFFVAHGEVAIRGLDIVNANADEGAAIYNAGSLSVERVNISNANAENGAAIYNAATASLDLLNVVVSNVAATGNGGAIYNAGSLVANNIEISNATANDGAAIYNLGTIEKIADSIFTANVAADQAGAIYNEGGSIDVERTTFDGNSAKYGGALVNYQATATIADSAFKANSASGDAGAIDNYGDLALTNVAFESNSTNGFGGAIYNSASSSSEAYVVDLDGVSFTANQAAKGGAIYNAQGSELVGSGAANVFGANVATDGGAIYSAGSIKADSAWTFEGNAATGNGGALYIAQGTAEFQAPAFVGNSAENGGAIYNAGTFKANKANLKANSASAAGGAIYNYGGKASVVMSNSLVWLNEAGTNGGAIALVSGSATLRNVTVAGNVAGGMGGGVYSAGKVSAYNTIVASNLAGTGVDYYATTAGTFAYSLLGNKSDVNKAPTMTKSVSGDAGFAVAPIFENGALVNADQVSLKPLADSIAVNSGNDAYALDYSGKALEFDFDGNYRICSPLDSVDMGAYEFPFEEPSNVVTTNLDLIDPTDGYVSIREALAYAERLGLDTVVFDPSVTGIILESTLYVDTNVTIGSATQAVTFELKDGDEESVVVVGSEDETVNVSLVNLTITGGDNRSEKGTYYDHPDYAGGGVRNFANLTLDKVNVTGNRAAYGGGVYNAGTMTIVDSVIADNNAWYYGGVYNRGELTVERTMIAENNAVYYGGGVGTYTGATISNSIIARNTAATGAGVFAQVNAAELLNGTGSFDVNLINVDVVGNVATGTGAEGVGAGVWANHVLNLTNSIVYGNTAAMDADLYYTTIFASSKLTATYSDVGDANVPLNGTGMKSVDPMFVKFDDQVERSAWDFSLVVGSKLIGAGNNAAVVGEFDAYGMKRVVGAKVDIGAVEEQGNLAPTDINIVVEPVLLSTDPVGTVVATVQAIDANEDDAFTYELVSDADGLFVVEGNEVKYAKEVPAGDYTVTVKAVDASGASVEKSFRFVVSNPAAPKYEAPEIVSVGFNENDQIVVEWRTDDPAKEFAVEYRQKGTSRWTSSSALTSGSDFSGSGVLEDASFEPGTVLELRIRALASSNKNESEWSEIVERTVEAKPEPFNVSSDLADDGFVRYEVASNANAYAYWTIDWNDGTKETFTGLAMERTLAHWYQSEGTFSPVLYVDNSTTGFELGAVTVGSSSSGAVLDVEAEVENVFSNLEPIAVGATVASASNASVAAAILAEATRVEWNAIADQVSASAEFAPTVSATVAVRSNENETAASVESRDAAFADFASFESADLDVDAEATDAIFDDAFLADLFED